MRIVCISDTHSMHEDIEHIPDGDILVHAGDCLARGALFEIEDFNYWLGELPYSNKILVAGNHDWCFQNHNDRAKKLVTNAIYLASRRMIPLVTERGILDRQKIPHF
ncbi:MAG: metallophosphoesterase [Marinobacter sp.]|uniref:metallophosphoesterase n=1 Tax=Marinobacter sp. TaxID=50741 RepID=UPI00396E65E5